MSVKIKLAFYKENKSIVDKGIAWWTNGPYSHVELLIDKRTAFGTDDELERIVNDTISEYRQRGLSKKMCHFKDKYVQFSSLINYGGVRIKTCNLNNDVCDYLNIEVDDIKIIIDFYKLILNQKYDLLGILGFIIPIQDRTNRWFCSETTTNALKICGLKELWLLEPSTISPNKLYNLLKNYHYAK